MLFLKTHHLVFILFVISFALTSYADTIASGGVSGDGRMTPGEKACSDLSAALAMTNPPTLRSYRATVP